jgi:hypothetical protein
VIVGSRNRFEPTRPPSLGCGSESGSLGWSIGRREGRGVSRCQVSWSKSRSCGSSGRGSGWCHRWVASGLNRGRG